MSALGNLVKGPATKALDDALKAAPASISTGLASAGVALTGTTAKASALFTGLYTQATTGIAAWLPTIQPWLLTQAAKVVASIKVSLGKL